MIKEEFYNYIIELQDRITEKFESFGEEDATFKEDLWQRDGGGGGRTRVIENGCVFEKGGVNISRVYGLLSPNLEEYFQIDNASFEASGISLVVHPRNPFVPSVHANFRYFELYKEGKRIDAWFGGGLDLTPYYILDEDVKHFHSVCKDVCDQFTFINYQDCKERCDQYFYNSHRKEARGVGGLFYDHLRANNEVSLNDLLVFQKAIGHRFLDAYVPIVEKRLSTPYTPDHKEWQLIRRGRYVEFNLIHDKGTLFGLKSNGRIESILMSLPLEVKWRYDHHPSPGSPEERLIRILETPQDWV